ncbi:Acid-resistance protein [Cyclobacterium qasimii M12-11B]|uniref:Acid-resistance protein n=2 Tax=Cyclobacterium qasimii TaxID=1350429 RepID=S7VKY9_9BACT|nr:Acid-resistance protein [Cyclobacterium qasimii M12-11B]
MRYSKKENECLYKFTNAYFGLLMEIHKLIAKQGITRGCKPYIKMNKSHLSKKEINRGEVVNGNEIRDGIFDFIKSQYPDFSRESIISIGELNKYRRLYLTKLIEQEKGDLAAIDKDVMDAIRNNSILSENLQEDIDTAITLGQRMADKIASFGGSWTFIIAFFSFLTLWIIANIWLLASNTFDPYPFILLNLMLSCIAAIQAPIIMMSQNRQGQKDRQRAELDYKINLKSELEIQLLNEKIDHLLVHQNKKLLEVQEVQIDYLEDLMKELKNSKPDHKK